MAFHVRVVQRVVRAHADQGGQTVVLVALLFTMLLGFTGLAVDGGRFYAERRFLQSAADAAALACASKVTAGASATDAEAQGKDILRTHLLRGDPSGSAAAVSDTPVYTTWFNASGSADRRNLADGVVAGSIDCRVALQVPMRTLFMQLFGTKTLSVPANAHAKARGGMMPVVVNRYKDPPGPSTTFLDYVKQEQYQTDHPNTCSQNGGGGCPDASGAVPPSLCLSGGCAWGPEAVIVGTGYSSSDSDFRGFIALDIRDFSTVDGIGDPVHQYYNNTTGANSSTLKDQESSYVQNGYPGPDLPPYDPGANPVQKDLQVATMSGSSAGVVVNEFAQHVRIGDPVLVQVFDGQVRQIPDFTISPPSSIPASSPSGPADGPQFNVGANQRFTSNNDTVHLDMVRDAFNNGAGSDTPSSLHDFTFSPSDFVPQGGNGTKVTIKNLQVDSGQAAGIYSVILRGTGHQPDGTVTSTHQAWVPLNIGGVARDFSMDFSSGTTQQVDLGVAASYAFQLSTGSGSSAWNGSSVAVAVDRATCSSGQVALVAASGGVQCTTATIGASPNFVPTKTGSPTVTVQISTTGVPTGTYTLVVRGRGTNGSSQPVVHVQQLTLAIGTSLGGTTSYVNVQGYALFVVTYVDSNTVKGRAITGYYADPDDAALAMGRRPGLVPWEIAPY